MLLKVDNVGAERMSSGRLFQATGPATQKSPGDKNKNCTLSTSLVQVLGRLQVDFFRETTKIITVIARRSAN